MVRAGKSPASPVQALSPGHRTPSPRCVREVSGLTDEELFITYRPELDRLCGKKYLFFVGENDRGHWIDGGEHGVASRVEVFALRKLASYAHEVRLAVIPRLTHYGHIESYNERLANLMVTGIKDYFPTPLG